MTQLLTTRDVLRMLGMSRTTLHRLRTGGAFPRTSQAPERTLRALAARRRRSLDREPSQERGLTPDVSAPRLVRPGRGYISQSVPGATGTAEW